MSTIAKPEAVHLTEQPKRKRGRPRKLPQESAGPLPPKKPRGRPKGSKERNASSRQKEHASAEKKPRGRPRKWLVIQEEDYWEASAQGSSKPSSSTQPATAGTSVKGCQRTKQFRGSSNTSPAVVQQQSSS